MQYPALSRASRAGCDPDIGTDPRALGYYYERRAFNYGGSARALLEKKDYKGSAESSTTSAHIYSDGTGCYVSLGKCDTAASAAESAKEAADFAKNVSKKAVKSCKGGHSSFPICILILLDIYVKSCKGELSHLRCISMYSIWCLKTFGPGKNQS